MNKHKVKEVLECIGSVVSKDQSRTGWTIASCPLGPWKHGADFNAHTNVTFGVRDENGDNFCHCFSCSFHGSLYDVVTEMQIKNKMSQKGVFDFKSARTILDAAVSDLDFDSPDIEQTLFGAQVKVFTEYPDWWLSSFPPVASVPLVRDYLISRDVPEALWSHFDLRADQSQKRVCLPVRDFQGRLAGFHGRAVEEGVEPRYRMYTYQKKNNPIVWYGEHYVNPELPVVWVEGYFDLMAVSRVYENVVSPLFANPSFEKMNRMGDCYEIITLFDHGTGGDKGRERVTLWAGKRPVTHLKPPSHRKDAAVMSLNELVELLGEHVTLRKKLVA